jgi:hypothetical protein
MRIVIQQPIFFPWCGYIELAKAADIFVHYDNVQLPRAASFTTRVQLKTRSGIMWLSAPVDRSKGHIININESFFSGEINWRHKHIKSIEHLYGKTQNFKQMMDITLNIYNQKTNNVAEFDQYCDEMLMSFFGVRPKILKSSEIPVSGSKTEKLVNICKELGADVYITGHGALNYLDYNLFEKNNIEVQYINYSFKPWKQFGEWTPYVTSLDLIANTGKDCINHLDSTTVYWRDFINTHTKKTI